MTMQARLILIAIIASLSFYAGVKVTNNARDAELYAAQQANEKLLIERGQEAADIIQGVLDEKQKSKVIYRTKYVDKVRIIERTNKCKLDDDSLRLWQEAIDYTNSEAASIDAALSTTSSTH